MTRDALADHTQRRLGLAGLLFAVIISIFLIHHSFSSILSNLKASGQSLEAEAKDDSDNQYIVSCYENWNSPFAEYSFNEMLARYKELVPVKETGFNTKNPVQCSAKWSGKVFTQEQVRDSIVFMGGTIAFGKGIPHGDSFQEIIQETATDRKSRPVKIVDFTLDAFDLSFFAHKFAILVQMKPEAIVYVWSPSDTPCGFVGHQEVCTNPLLLDQTNHFVSDNNQGVIEIQLINGALTTFRERRDALQQCRSNHSEVNKQGLESLLNTIKSMRDQAQAAGVDFKVVLFPLMQGRRNHYEFTDIHNKMAGLLNRNSISYIDLAPGLFNGHSSDLTVNAVNMRPNVQAHAIVANQLVPFLNLEKPKTVMASGKADTRIRPSGIPKNKYALVEEQPFCLLIFFLLMLLLCSCAIAFVFHLPTLIRQIAASGAKSVLALAIIIFYAGWLRIVISPHAHLVLGDEYDRLRVVEMWIAGVFGANTINFFPGPIAAFFPGYLLFGLHSNVGFNISIFMSVFSCILLFVVVKLLIKSNFAALTAALLLATYPVCLRFSGSHAAEIPNLMFMLISVYAFLVNRDKRDFISSFLLFSSLSFFMFIRIHNIAFAAFLLYCHVRINLTNASDGTERVEVPRTFFTMRDTMIKSRADLLPVLMFAVSAICCLVLMYLSVTRGDYKRNLDGFIFTDNLLENLQFFISDWYLPITYSIFGCIALILGVFRKDAGMRRAVAFIASWTIIYFLCHLQAQSAQYLRNSESVRHTIDFAAPLLTLAAIGIFVIDSMLFDKAAKYIYRFFLFVFIALIPFAHINQIRDKGYADNVTRATLVIAERFPSNTLFVTNAFLMHDALDLDLRANVRLTNSPESASRLCANRKECVLVLYNESRTGDFEFIHELCPQSIHYLNRNVAVCPFDKAANIPARFFRLPSFEKGGGDYRCNLPYGMNLRNDTKYLISNKNEKIDNMAQK